MNLLRFHRLIAPEGVGGCQTGHAVRGSASVDCSATIIGRRLDATQYFNHTGICDIPVLIPSTGSCEVAPSKHRLLQHCRACSVRTTRHDPEASCDSLGRCEGGEEEKIRPRIRQSVSNRGQDKTILALFVLSREDCSLLSATRQNFWAHVIITLPHDLNPLWLANVPVMSALLFQAASDTLVDLLADPQYLGAQPGILAALHTWSQTLVLHPHVHCLVTGGGLTPDGHWKAVHHGFLLPARVVMAVF